MAKKRKVRYDRVLAVAIVFILLIVLLCKCMSSCASKKGETESTANTGTTETTTKAETTPDYSNVVYLSPSNQGDNAFNVGDTTEAAECRKIAEKTSAILQASGLTVITAGENDSVTTKAAMGKYNVAAYVAIHTNEGDGTGTDCYYNSENSQSQAIAEAVYNKVADLTPTDDRGLLDGVQTGSDNYQEELAENPSPCCLIEVEYHDGPHVAQWILDNEDSIAEAIAEGICEYLNVSIASTATDSDATGETSETEVTEESNAIENQLSADLG